MTSRLLTYMLPWLGICLLAGCQDQGLAGDTVGSADGEDIRLAMAFQPGRSGGSSRMSAAATQADEQFRGISDFYVIPFATQGKVQATDQRLESHLKIGNTIPTNGLIGNNNAVFFERVHVPHLTSSFLVYGHAPQGSGSAADKFTYGSLVTDVDQISGDDIPGSITFAPEPIVGSTDVPAAASGIAAYLTSIANVANWATNTNATLQQNYRYLVNYVGDSYLIQAGSSAAVNRLLSKIYTNLNSTLSGSSNNTIRNNVRSAIANNTYADITDSGTDAVVTLKGDYSDYPARLNLPDGAAGLQWNNAARRFDVVTQTTTASNIMAMDRICYPPSLWYYANSRIKTSDVDWEKEHYVPASATWNTILAEYANDDASVYNGVQSVAIKNGINYGVADLSIGVRCVTSLTDNRTNGGTASFSMTASSTIFPLTAIIVGQQRMVDYDFCPYASEEYTVYDKRIADDGRYMRPVTPSSAADYTNTLVLQTRDDEKVYIILEYQNNSTQDFQGANGLIYRGSKFYLTAVLDPNEKSAYRVTLPTGVKSVFRQDTQTRVGFVIQNLATAWNVVPDLRDPRLEIGVQLDTQWIQSTTTNVGLN